MKLAWLTDVHLNFLSEDAKIKFYREVVDSSCDRVVISGDIAEARSIIEILKGMASEIKKPIYFVLGNHDYYGSDVISIRNKMQELCESEQLLHWLPFSGVQKLENQTIILGEDCWGDGRFGDYGRSRVQLNDSVYIKDLSVSSSKEDLLRRMQLLADNDAKQLDISLRDAIINLKPAKVLVIIHVPPFRETSMHEGKISNDDFLPFFSSKVTGDVLLKVAAENEGIEFIVLCGHTHSSAFWQPLRNLTVKAGAAIYCKPNIQEIFIV
mmetsp:Transcript_29521/g.40563  ORF Transcript_29521/g.40563 Transcript_29521/m.40563 type:complete len:268 (+) Transcript_29521:600-1403(+)